MPATELDKAYAAGLMDGEGGITIFTPNGSYILQVYMGSVTRVLLDFMQERWGGSVSQQKKKTSAGNTMYRWCIYSNKAVAVLEDVADYLLVKKERALFGVEFQKHINECNFRRIPDEERATRREYKEKMTQLNKLEKRLQM